MRIGVIADIHGNVAALEAVLDRLQHASPDMIINLGDCASGPLWPAETVSLLRATEMLHVRGNHDRALGATSPEGLGRSDLFAWERLEAADRAWLSTLPEEQFVAGAHCFHATPGDDEAYLMERVADGRLLPDSSAAVESRLAGTQARLVLCGHSHLPRLLRLPAGVLVVNPGSVGCPAYHDDTAPAHVSESGSPHARFAIVTLSPAITVEHHAIAYDWDAAAARARQSGRDDWALALATGTAQA
ncbi:MAG TPA: metallophosphoesterase family protein [Bosea sp. (in: a-proteobacteria)]|jgi:putative phosphoesterase|uniref:metallophosphoesterase family protein n=1 Tax=Bosea sp. (in: a-proteobacteria) TaxID=1871050 RepID=UPI002E13C5CF|nr:metallophosphoesterase family protein [Bosea sp. (in: a-proteobacteria)]